MNIWPENDLARCPSVHPEDPEIQCDRTAGHEGIHATMSEHWWRMERCDALLGEGGTGRRCITAEGHTGDHTDEDGYRW